MFCITSAVSVLGAYKPAPAEKHNRNCNGFNGYNGNCIGFNGSYNGVYWFLMDSIGGVLNPIGRNAQNTIEM